MELNIRYNDLKRHNSKFTNDFVKALNELIISSEYILGTALNEFEKEFAAFCDTSSSLGVSSGMSALVIALRSLDLPPKSEVILPANSFIATASAVLFAGYEPKLVDVNDNFLISVESISEKISKKTKVIIPVHLHGRICDMDPILDIARQNGIYVIEDAAQAVGALLNGRKSGSFGIAGCFSFYPGKNLGALGDGGAVTSSNEYFLKLAYLHRNYGSQIKYEHEIIAGNDRLDTLQAMFLSIKLKQIEHHTELRRKVAQEYISRIENPLIQLPASDTLSNKSSWHNFVIRCETRDKLASFLKENGIETIKHYPKIISRQRCFGNYFVNDHTPIAERQSERILSIPIFPEIETHEISYIVDKLNKYYG